MKIKFIETIVGKGFAYYSGDVRALPNDVAKKYVDLGYAEVVAEAPSKRAERAVVGGSNKKKKKK